MNQPNFLGRFRGKTEAQKQRLAFGGATALTALIAIVWAANFLSGLTANPVGQNAAVGEIAAQGSAPWKVFADIIRSPFTSRTSDGTTTVEF